MTVVGTTMKVDMRMVDATQGRFARVCIEIYLNKPMIGRVWFRDHWFHVEYKGLHLICNKCEYYGYIARTCPKAKEDTVVVQDNSTV